MVLLFLYFKRKYLSEPQLPLGGLPSVLKKVGNRGRKEPVSSDEAPNGLRSIAETAENAPTHLSAIPPTHLQNNPKML